PPEDHQGSPGPDPRREAYIQAMEGQTGKPYTWGGKTPDPGFDCSGLLTWGARQAGFDLGDPDFTNANGLKRYCTPVPEPVRGDLVLFVKTYYEDGVNPDTWATHCGVVLDPAVHVMIDKHGTPTWPA